MRSNVLLCLFLSTALYGCAASAPRAEITDDMRESMLRELFKDVPDSCAVFFIQVGDHDPSPQLLSRFDGHSPPVKPASHARIGTGGRTGVWDNQTGETGALLSISDTGTKGSVQRSNRIMFRDGKLCVDSEVAWHVAASWYMNGISAAWTGFTFVRRNGKLVLVPSAWPGVIIRS